MTIEETMKLSIYNDVSDFIGKSDIDFLLNQLKNGGKIEKEVTLAIYKKKHY